MTERKKNQMARDEDLRPPSRLSPLTISAVWRSSGEDFDVDAFVRRFPELGIDSIYRRGELFGKRVSQSSGFNCVLAEEGEFGECVDESLAALEEIAPALRVLASLGVESEIDFGLLVGGSDFFVRSACLGPAEMLRFAEAGLAVRFTAYPWDEDEDEDEDDQA